MTSLASSLRVVPLPRLHVRTLLVIVALGCVFVLNVFGFTDPDFWWHLRTGQYIVETQSIPHTDLFSYTAFGKPWITHEWLSQILMYLLYDSMGYWANVVFFAAIVTLTFFLLFRLVVKLGVNEVVAICLVFWSALIMRPFFTVRPLTFTWLLFVVFLSLLYSYHRGQARHLWLLPLLMVLWINLHGGFFIGLLLIGLLIATRLAERWLLHKEAEVRHLMVVFGLSLLASLANPNGLLGLAYPISYMGMGNPSARLIIEWQSPDFHNYYWLLFLVPLFVTMALGLVNRSLGLWPLLLTIVLATMGFQSLRHIPLYALAAAPILGETLRSRYSSVASSQRPAQSISMHSLNWLLLASLLAAAVILAWKLPYSQMRQTPLLSRGFSYPEEGAEYVRDHYPNARLFNEYGWGGYLIYTLYPNQKVFIDGRADVYGESLMNQHSEVVQLKPNWREVLEQYGVDLLLIEKDSRLSVLLDAAEGWEKVFSGSVEDVFVKGNI